MRAETVNAKYKTIIEPPDHLKDDEERLRKKANKYIKKRWTIKYQ